MKQESDFMPSKEYLLEVVDENSCDVILNDLNSVKEITRETEEGTSTSYEYYSFRLNMQNSERLEDYVKENYGRLLNSAKEQLENRLAKEIRDKRNRLLEESDKQMAFDRLGFEISDNISISNIVSVLKNFFNGIKNISNGEWAKYRQALRDITNQEGFPYNVIFPEKPKE